jgi:phosphohistidine phosphatase SixA
MLRAARGVGPRIVMLMRHGEDKGEDDFHLNSRGIERAGALPKLFGARLPAPQVIVATRASKRSDRPVETVKPLARALNLPIDNRFKDDDYQALADRLLNDDRFAGKVVLVCWHHGTLPELASALGVKNPGVWPKSQFDHVWVIEFEGKRPKLDDVPQRLMPGDR